MPATTRSDHRIDYVVVDRVAMRRADADKEVGALIVTSALDGREELMAFLEKRRAQWTGH